MSKFFISAILALAGTIGLGACGTRGETIGTIGGAVGGAAVGSAVTGGSTLGTIGGAAAGGYIGHELGEEYERRNR